MADRLMILTLALRKVCGLPAHHSRFTFSSTCCDIKQARSQAGYNLSEARSVDVDGDSAGFIDCLPSGWQVEITESQPTEPLQDVAAELDARLADPLGTLPLTELCGVSTRVVIVSDDLTTPDTRMLMLQAVLRQLEHAGVDPDRVTMLIPSQAEGHIHGDDTPAAGTHGYAGRIHVVRHDPNDLRELDDLGIVEGAPLLVNYRAVEADVLIAISSMPLEDDTRDSGSAGMLAARLTGSATQRELRTTRFLDDQAEPAGLALPLLNRVAREVSRRAGLAFVVDAIVDARGCVLAMHAGAPNAVNDALLRELYAMRDAGAQSYAYDVLLPDSQQRSGLYDASLDAIRMSLMRNPVLMRGGSLILPVDAWADALEDSEESRAFYDALTNAPTPDRVIEQLHGRSLKKGEDRAYLLAHVMQRHHVIAAGAPREQLARNSHFVPANDVREAGELAESYAGHAPRALVVRHARRSLPAFAGPFYGSDPFDDALMEINGLE
jgi:nickel-dependent lactate racemase